MSGSEFSPITLNVGFCFSWALLSTIICRIIQNVGAVNFRRRPQMFKASTKRQKRPRKEKEPGSILSFRGRFSANGRKIFRLSSGLSKRKTYPAKPTLQNIGSTKKYQRNYKSAKPKRLEVQKCWK